MSEDTIEKKDSPFGYISGVPALETTEKTVFYVTEDSTVSTDMGTGKGSAAYQDKIYFMLMFMYTRKMFEEKLEKFQAQDLIASIPVINYYKLREKGWKGSYDKREFTKGDYLIDFSGRKMVLNCNNKLIGTWEEGTSWEDFNEEMIKLGIHE